jgi:hypothetical protein
MLWPRFMAANPRKPRGKKGTLSGLRPARSAVTRSPGQLLPCSFLLDDLIVSSFPGLRLRAHPPSPASSQEKAAIPTQHFYTYGTMG